MSTSDNVVNNRLAWVRTWLETAGDKDFSEPPPFSFSFGGVEPREHLGEWNLEHSFGPPDASGCTHRTVTYRDLPSGLAVRCETVEYSDFAAVEWTPHFRN